MHWRRLKVVGEDVKVKGLQIPKQPKTPIPFVRLPPPPPCLAVHAHTQPTVQRTLLSLKCTHANQERVHHLVCWKCTVGDGQTLQHDFRLTLQHYLDRFTQCSPKGVDR